MLTLIQFPPGLGMRNPSPFCLKAEALLRHSKLPYEVDAQPHPGSAPKGKFPVLRDGDALIPDSSFIRHHLEEQHGIDFDAGLSDEQKAVAHAFGVLCEEHLYWTLVYSRWAEEENWQVFREAFFGPIPWPIRGLIAAKARRGVLGRLRAHGMGLHSREEIYAFGARDLQAISAQLGTKPFLMGDSPCGADATVFGIFHSVLASPIKSPLLDAVRAKENLVAYTERLEAFYFG